MNKDVLVSFPYSKTSNGRFFPVVPLKLRYRKELAKTSALIDSGATTSIFRPEVAEGLGIGVESGEEIYLSGVGGRIRGYLHKLEIEVAGKKFKCPIIFSYEYTVSLNLLGREGFFGKFIVVFDEEKKKIRLE
jgi:hypothetical protein